MKVNHYVSVIAVTALCLLPQTRLKAQAPAWLWATSAGNFNDESGRAITVDNSGNVIVAGDFNSSSIVFGAASLLSAGSDDWFVVKYDAAGNVLWARQAGGVAVEKAYGVTTDAGGNIIVCGEFRTDSVVFGTDTLHHIFGADILIVKYDPAGNVLWARGAGGAGDDFADDVAVDANGNIYLCGEYFSQTLVIGSDTLQNSSFGYSDLFVVKLDSSGNILWARGSGGDRNERGFDIVCDTAGNAYLAGLMVSPFIFFGNDTLINAGLRTSDICLLKYDPNGNPLWGRRAGGSMPDDGYAVRIDAAGNIFMAGPFMSTVFPFGTDTVSCAGSVDIWVLKYDPSGNPLWIRSAGGPDNDFGYNMTIDGAGNVYAVGTFTSASITFGTTVLTNASAGTADVFMVKYDSNGNVLWATSAGGPGVEFIYDVAADAAGQLFVTGSFSSSSLMMGASSLANAGGTDVLVAAMGSAVGLEEHGDQMTTRLWPNPVTTRAVLQFSREVRNATITVVDQTGREVKVQKQVSGRAVELVCERLSGGMYVVRLTEGKTLLATRKMVVSD
jgi:hypothetical protein